MPLIIPPGFLQAVYIHMVEVDPEPMVVTCGHEIGDGGASGSLAANDLFTLWSTHICPATMTSDTAFIGVTVYVGQDGGPPLVFESDEAATTGDQGGSGLPQNCATLVRKRTGAAGRRGRGRFYLPGVPRPSVNDVGIIDPAQVTQVDGAFSDWKDALEVSVGGRHYPPVVLHRSEGIGVEPAPTPITAFTTDGVIATQRRRLRR